MPETISVQAVVVPPADVDVFGEGPHWEPSTQSLLYVDAVHNKAIYRWDSITKTHQTFNLNSTTVPSFVIPRESGGYVVAIGKQLFHLDWSSSSLTPLSDLSGMESEKNNKINDGKCDKKGRLWAGTLPQCIKESVDDFPREQGSLFSIEKGDIQRHVDKITMSNGLAWSMDERILFFVDSFARKIFAFDFDLDCGNISNQRMAISFPADSIQTLGYPDGMTIDTDGKLWVACALAGKIAQFDPEIGKMLRSIEFPVKAPTSCCFGGINMDELYVTTGRRDTFGDDTQGRTPLPGALFKVTGLGVKGQTANIYHG